MIDGFPIIQNVLKDFFNFSLPINLSVIHYSYTFLVSG